MLGDRPIGPFGNFSREYIEKAVVIGSQVRQGRSEDRRHSCLPRVAGHRIVAGIYAFVITDAMKEDEAQHWRRCRKYPPKAIAVDRLRREALGQTDSFSDVREELRQTEHLIKRSGFP